MNTVLLIEEDRCIEQGEEECGEKTCEINEFLFNPELFDPTCELMDQLSTGNKNKEKLNCYKTLPEYHITN